MLGTFIDYFLILLFLFACYKLYAKSFKKKKGKLLCRSVSLFILFHIIIFPIIYVLIINNNPKSIEINDQIIENEKSLKLKEFNQDNKINYQHQKSLINKVLVNNDSLFNNIYVGEISDNKILKLKSHLLFIHWEFTPPGKSYFKRVLIFDKLGNKFTEFTGTYFDEEKLIDVFNAHIENLTSEENKKTQELNTINSNSFWTYRRILSYTLNILSNGNFNPISPLSNNIYWVHQCFFILILGFIGSSLFKYISKNETSP